MTKKSDIAKSKPRVGGKFVSKNSMPPSGDNSINKTVPGMPWIAQPEDTFVKNLPPGVTPVAPNVFHANIFRAISQTPSQIFRNLDEALRASRLSAKAMLNDGAISSPLFQRILHLVSANDGLVPEDENDPKQIEVCEKLWKIIQRMPNWAEFKRTLAEALWYGKCANVTDFTWHYENGEKQMIPKGFVNIIGDKLVFRTNGRMGYICHTPTGQRDVVVTDIGRAELFNQDDDECITHHKYMIVDVPYDEGMLAIGQEGFGYRHYLYWLWWLKQSVLEWALQGLHLFGSGGLRVAYFEESNPSSEKAVADAMSAANGSNIILFPRPIGEEQQGAGLEIISPAGLGLEWFIQFLDGYFGKQINAMLLGADWDTERKDFYAYLRYDAQKLSATIQQGLVDVLLKYNFPGYKHKVNYEIAIPHYNPEMVLTAAQRLFEMGSPVGATEVASLVGLTIPGKGRRILQKSEQEMMMGDQTMKKPIVGGDRDLGDQLSGGTGKEQAQEQQANGEENAQNRENISSGLEGVRTSEGT